MNKTPSPNANFTHFVHETLATFQSRQRSGPGPTDMFKSICPQDSLSASKIEVSDELSAMSPNLLPPLSALNEFCWRRRFAKMSIDATASRGRSLVKIHRADLEL